MKNTATKVKNFAVRNKTRILLSTTVIATTMVVIQARAIKLHNEFLDEKGLSEEFYAIDEIDA